MSIINLALEKKSCLISLSAHTKKSDVGYYANFKKTVYREASGCCMFNKEVYSMRLDIFSFLTKFYLALSYFVEAKGVTYSEKASSSL